MQRIISIYEYKKTECSCHTVNDCESIQNVISIPHHAAIPITPPCGGFTCVGRKYERPNQQAV